MATVVSPGVSVTVTDDSFFIPAAASTVPLIFIATASEKQQPNGDAALGTYQHNVVRTVTSLEQSVRSYGVPLFHEDFNNNPHHGDARNEYGLFALNQFLGAGNRAYVVRANVNLNDDRDSILSMWQRKIQQNTVPVGAAYILEGLANDYLNEYNATNGFIPADAGYKVTLTKSEFLSLSTQALDEIMGTQVIGTTTFFEEATFSRIRPDLLADHSASPLNVFGTGYEQAPTGTFLGLEGEVNAWEVGALGSVVSTELTPQEARDLLITSADDFQYTQEFLNQTSLGANDAARRVAVAQALASTINSNTEIRSENAEYNLILAPGYPEVCDELVALSADIKEEAFVLADTPMNMTPEEVVNWGDGSVLPWPRQHATTIAYYYPHGLASNLDGREVLCSASGIALRTITYSDNASEVWFAPAGLRRGVVTGVAAVGHVTGTLGGPTTFNQVNLNAGQRDNMYKYFTNLNPIVNFPGRGIVVFGQKTSANAASARDRINVERLIMYIKRQLRKNTMSYLFEPNDQLTRDSLKATVDNFLGDIMIKRGLYDFATVCDESNNTPARIDRNEMYIDIALKPVKAAEFLSIPIRIVSTGADI
jgi:phage tail sheath protein FI